VQNGRLERVALHVAQHSAFDTRSPTLQGQHMRVERLVIIQQIQRLPIDSTPAAAAPEPPPYKNGRHLTGAAQAAARTFAQIALRGSALSSKLHS
jgi:hypothetical protein